MRRAAISIVGLGASLLCGACQRGAAATAPNGQAAGTVAGAAEAADFTPASPSLVPAALTTFSIDDPALGMSAITLKVPADWRSAGTIIHAECDLTPIPAFRANTPDGMTGVQLFPRFDSIWSPGPNAAAGAGACRFSAPQSPIDFVRTVLLPQARPGAEIVSDGPVPGDKTPQQVAAANAAAPAQQATINQRLGANIPPPRFNGESRRIRIRYPSSGRTLEEDLDVAVVSQDMSIPAAGPMGMTFSHLVKTQTTVIGTRAPAGSLDAVQPVSAAIGASLKIDQGWYQRALAQAQQILNRRDEANRQRANAFAGQTIANIHAVGAASMAAAARSEAARHAGAQAFIQHMGDRETVMDPGTGRTADISNQYNHSYYDAQAGQVMQTNSAYSPGANWTELQVVPPR